MTDNNTNNRRQFYRHEPPPLGAPLLSLKLDGRHWTAEQVINVSLKGVRLVFKHADLPALATGQAVITSIKVPGMASTTEIASRVVLSATRGTQRVVAIAFTGAPDLGDHATADFFRIFNRREDPRRDAGAGQAVLSALVLNADGSADGVIDLELRDLSDKGVGFIVDNPTDAFLRDGASLALPVPGQQQAVCPAQVRRRDEHDDSVHYGCTFDGV
ncbi:MAG: PilZ domain-containing protein [Gammaproteobacteria bacterium]|nr:PilZ domain-containing protein [Gammaproteobacteria bacterium]